MRAAVYLGSHAGKSPIYMETAYELGARLAKAGIGLVYGGASIGCMEALSEGVASEGGECIGVFPQGFKGKPDVAAAGIDIRRAKLTRDIVVKDFPERKKMMESLSNFCIALPGSWGTMDELFAYGTSTQLGFNGGKPIFVLNLNGYYDPLRQQILKMYEEGFIDDWSLNMFCFVPTLDALFEEIKKLK